MKVVCNRCNSDRGFAEYGSVLVEASRDVDVWRRADGCLEVSSDSYIDVESAGHPSEFEHDEYRCLNCSARAGRIEDLIRDDFRLEAGDAVYCPDGMRGVIASVDLDACTVTVRGWHETFEFSEIRPVDENWKSGLRTGTLEAA